MIQFDEEILIINGLKSIKNLLQYISTFITCARPSLRCQV